MLVTAIQLSPGHVVEDNIRAAGDLISRACAASRPDLVVLPEMWSCLGGDLGAKRQAAEALPDEMTGSKGLLYSFLQDAARRHNIVLHGGSIAEMAGSRLYNTTLVFDRDGSELTQYRKIHLFDVVTPSGERYCESDVYRSGNEIATFRVDDTIVGCAICYDLRFGYLFEALREEGAGLIVLPAAFTAETGAAHWEVMIRARAIETQTWIVAAATTGQFVDGDGELRSTFGHSMISDPWGRVVAQASSDPGWVTASVERTLTEQVRQRMPVWQHRRTLRSRGGGGEKRSALMTTGA